MEKLTELLSGFDIPDALERFGGSEDVLLKYVHLMVRDFLVCLPEVRSLLSAGAFPEAAGCLHSLAGTAAALSATHLFDMCLDGERCARSQLGCEAVQHLEGIHSCISSLDLLLQTHLKIGGTH